MDSMETQVGSVSGQADMELQDVKEASTKNPTDEITEENFLKNLYIFMKKRDTPIERIPNLGFKQIDLFLMFKTVNDLGGYHQVTSHQLWKKVYNTLGGNPRSTSAATCTRRHYEKLLLPYECHLKGILINIVPQHQPKPYRFKDDDGGQRLSKRRLLSLPHPQGSPNFQLNPFGVLYPPFLHYHPYNHRPQYILPPYGPLLAPHVSTAPKDRFSFEPSPPESHRFASNPLEKLRNMAKLYKSSEGLAEPLDLSPKASAREASNSIPVSSFSQLPSSKNPKFLNKPSTLYSPARSGVARSEEGDIRDESVQRAQPFEHEDDKASMPSSSPIYVGTFSPEPEKKDVDTRPKPVSPQPGSPIRMQEDGEVSPGAQRFHTGFNPLKRSPPKESKMEIELPVSVFRDWLKMCWSSGKLPEPKEMLHSDHERLPAQKRSRDSNIFPTDLTTDRGSPQDLRLKRESSPASDQTCNEQSVRSLLTTAVQKDASIWPFLQQKINELSNFKQTELWTAHQKGILAPHIPGSADSNSVRPPKDLSPKFNMEDGLQEGKRSLDGEPSVVLMMNSSPTSVLHLTSEEVKRLKRIISN